MKKVIFQVLVLAFALLAQPSLAQVPQVHLNIVSSANKAKEKIIASLKREFHSKGVKLVGERSEHMLIDVAEMPKAKGYKEKERVWRLDAFLSPVQFRGKSDVIGYAFSACLVDDKDGELIYHILVCESDLEQIPPVLIEWLERDGVFKEMKMKVRR